MSMVRHQARWRVVKALSSTAILGGFLAACSSSSTPAASSGSGTSGGATNSHVLLVGTYNGKKGGYTSIQAAVSAAKPGDWILVAPGDYHETADHTLHLSSAELADGGVGGVIVTTPDLHIRGMDRNTVIVDGTKSGAPKACDSAPEWQDDGITTGPPASNYGRNGIVVFKANDVWIENLTVCNFLNGSGQAGNGVWWNGGGGTGQIGLTSYYGSYLTATSTYFGGEKTASAYGIFASNASGPATWNELYANNYNDSGMYVGACRQVCGITIDHAWMEYNALGYSGTNSGGAIVIENSQFDNNEDGLDTNTAISGDPPAPANGACPNNETSPITHTHSCWVFIHNYVHDNNNPNSPAAGSAAQGPYGTGMTVSGARNMTVMDNRFVNNGAWGVLFVPYPDSGKPVMGQTCTGSGGTANALFGCVIDPSGNALIGNTFTNDGYFHNPTNSDFGELVLYPGKPVNCFSGNTAPNGSAPPNLETTSPTCGPIATTATNVGELLSEVACDNGLLPCTAGEHYPKPTKVVMHPLPASLPTMPDPCSGVPSNPWCPKT
jgi:hypothetical protein